MNNSDQEFTLCEKTLHSEMVFAIRRFFVYTKGSMKSRHKAVFDTLNPLVEESKYLCEIWENDGES